MKQKIQVGIGFLVGTVLMWWLFKDMDWEQAWAATRRANLGWMLVATALVFISFYVRVQRWTYIVRTAKPVSYRHMFSATQIGFLFNFTMPARLGELIRAVVLSRLAQLPFSKSIAFVALDRVLDLVSLMAVVAITVAVFTPIDMVYEGKVVVSAGLIRKSEYMVGVMLVCAVAGFVLLYVKQALVLGLADKALRRFSGRFADKAVAFMQHFVDGLHIFRSGSDMLKAVLYSLLTWTICVGVFISMMKAFHIEGPWYTAIVMEMFLAVAISVPITPGFIGQFQAPLLLGLVVLTNADKTTAQAFSLVTHFINLIPVIIIGFYCIYRDGLSLSELKHETEEIAEKEAVAKG